jgi:hypothetical protein
MAERQSRQMMKERFVKRINEQQEREQKGAGTLFKRDIKGLKFFKCGERQHTIDIIPYFAGKCDPYVPEGEEAYVFEFFIHRDVGVGEGSIMCLAETYGEPCPICEDRRKKIRDGADEKSLNKLRPARNPRSVYNIICYDDADEEAKGVQIFHTSHYLMEAQLQELAKVPIRAGQKGIDPLVVFMDPDAGKSIVFKREGTADKTRFTGMRFADRPQGFKIDQRDLDDAWALDEIVYRPTYEEVYEYYYGRSGGRAAAQVEDPAPVERPARSGRSRSETREEAPAPAATTDPCPSGHKFGIDVDRFPKDCEPCEQWRACARKAKEVASGVVDSDEAKKPSDPPPAAASESRRSRRGGGEEQPPDPPSEASSGRRRRA